MPSAGAPLWGARGTAQGRHRSLLGHCSGALGSLLWGSAAYCKESALGNAGTAQGHCCSPLGHRSGAPGGTAQGRCYSLPGHLSGVRTLAALAPFWCTEDSAPGRCRAPLGHRSGVPGAPLRGAAARCWGSSPGHWGHRSGALPHAAGAPLRGTGGAAQGRLCAPLGHCSGAPGAPHRGDTARCWGTDQGRQGPRSRALVHAAWAPLWGARSTCQGHCRTLFRHSPGAPGGPPRGATAPCWRTALGHRGTGSSRVSVLPGSCPGIFRPAPVPLLLGSGSDSFCRGPGSGASWPLDFSVPEPLGSSFGCGCWAPVPASPDSCSLAAGPRPRQHPSALGRQGHRSRALPRAPGGLLWGAGGTAQGRRCTLPGHNTGAPVAPLWGADARR
jgi:hypothetical protein